MFLASASGMQYAYTPKSRVEFWEKKFASNIARDKVVMEQLQTQGIRTLVIWECTTRIMSEKTDIEADIIKKVEEFLHSDRDHEEL